MAPNNPIKSEDVIPDTLDKCLADGLIKTGSGIALGAALSLVIFKRRMWPLYVGFGSGLGMAVANCQHSLGSITNRRKEPPGSGC